MLRLIAVLILLAGALEARAQETTALSVLIHEAVRLSGYTEPATPPTLSFESEAQMSQRLCHGRLHCPVFGAYFDDDVIHVREGLIPDGQDHIVLHEMVHWLQHHSDRYDLNSCEDTIEREREAFRIENLYIAEVQHGFEFIHMPPMSCPES